MVSRNKEPAFNPLHPDLVLVIGGKGGVGKTAVAFGITASLNERGARVSLVDLDPQAGATLAAGIPRAGNPLDAIADGRHGFAVYPASRNLALASPNAIARYLQEVLTRHSLVVADLSPALTDAAHTAALPLASLVLVVARTDAAGLANVAESVQLCREYGRPYLVVPNMLTRTKLAREAHAMLRQQYSPNVAYISVPLEARAAEAAAVCRPITVYAPNSATARALDSVASEVVDTLGGWQ